jgi:peptidoglycan/LPS O-acetylase OafA/YrhL
MHFAFRLVLEFSDEFRLFLSQLRDPSEVNEALTNRVALGESKFLNILRGLAILGVISMHSAQSIQDLDVRHVSEHISQVLSLGKYGVEVFFFLSGWLLSALYGFSGTKIGKSYVVRRIARIYPLWIIFLVIYILEAYFLQSGGFFHAMHSSTDLKITQQPTVIAFLTLTFTLFISHTLWNTVIPGGWSIQSEVAHYALFPILKNQGLHRSAKILSIINLSSVVLLLGRSKIENVFPDGYSIVSTCLRLGIYSTFSFFSLVYLQIGT